jgi:hypothetical protein
MRRFALYGFGLLLVSAIALTYATSGRAKSGGPVSHTCSVNDRAFIDGATTNVDAVDLWGQQYLDGEAGPTEVAAESARAAKIVGATSPTDPSLAQTRILLMAMFTAYGKAMKQRARHREAGEDVFHAYGLANFAHDVLLKAEPALARRGCDVSPLL